MCTIYKAEDEKDLCYSINVLGMKYVVEAYKEIDSKMIYISANYVFEGKETSHLSWLASQSLSITMAENMWRWIRSSVANR